MVSSVGNIGIGTSLPEGPLHILRSSSGTGITLESTDISGGGGSKWTTNVGNFGYAVNDASIGSLPFGIRNGAPDFSIVIDETGNVGLGTLFPSAPFDLATDEAFNFFRITATGAAVNDSVDFVFTAGPLGTGQLRYNIVDGDNQEMSLDADGNMVLDGTLTTAGPTCSGGCDRVFAQDYPLPSITDHQQAMWQAGYLPNVGPTTSDAPVNVTEKMGNILNELEHAHIYIG